MGLESGWLLCRVQIPPAARVSKGSRDGKNKRSGSFCAEDDRFLRKATETTLRRRGFTVYSAADGEEALRMSRDEKPDAILLDMIMPKLQGFEVLRTLKADPDTARIPIIVLSNTQGRMRTSRAPWSAEPPPISSRPICPCRTWSPKSSACSRRDPRNDRAARDPRRIEVATGGPTRGTSSLRSSRRPRRWRHACGSPSSAA